MREELNLDILINCLVRHKGHTVVAVTYGITHPVNLSLECEDCNSVVADWNL